MDRQPLRAFFARTAAERRFGCLKTQHRVEWLSDNGGATIAKDTANTARALGLTLLFTPVRSPESNGMSESFVKMLRRDYARVNVLADAKTIFAKLHDCIKDYCEVHPHSGLKFRSPRSSSASVPNSARHLSGQTGRAPQSHVLAPRLVARAALAPLAWLAGFAMVRPTSMELAWAWGAMIALVLAGAVKARRNPAFQRTTFKSSQTENR